MWGLGSCISKKLLEMRILLWVVSDYTSMS